MRRVAHVIWRSQGGMRRHVKTLAAHPPSGWETVAVFGPEGLRSYFEGVPFSSITRSGSFLKGIKADVVHAHGINAAATALLPGGPPVVLTLHVVLGGSGVTARWRAAAVLAQIVTSRAAAVIAVSQQAAKGVSRARVIPPAFDPLPPPTSARERVREVLGARQDDVIALCVSRLEERKRLELFIRAIEAAGCIGWLVGDGPDRLRIETAAKRAPVRLLGHRSDVADLLGAADFFALPSASESYGIAVAEAIAAGLPVVATRTGAIGELVGAGGVVIDVDDVDGFVRAVETVATDASERTRLATAARQVRPPDRDALIARVGEVYDELTR